MDDVADLVISPFRDIVDKGRKAVENAGDDKTMLKASQSLTKEGERALKKIEPLCRKHLDEYGSNFLDALKENDEIAAFRTELNELLWEFEDYIELDDFEADKFAELQALSRKAAPKIYDILMRLKLEVPIDHDNRSIMTRMSGSQSRPISPDAPPMPPIYPFSELIKDTPRSASSLASESRSSNDPVTVEAATAELRRMMQSRSGPDEGLYAESPRSSHTPQAVLTPVEPPPRPPSGNPWDFNVKASPSSRDNHFSDDFSFERRKPVAPIESPVEPISPPLSPDLSRELHPRPLKPGGDRTSQYSNDSQVSSVGMEPTTYERTYSVFPSPRGRYSNHNSILSTSIPEDVVSDRPNTGYMSQLSPTPRTIPPRTHSLPHSRPESVETNPGSVFDAGRPDGATTPLTDNRDSSLSGFDGSPTLGTAEMSPLQVKHLPVNNYQGMLEPVQPIMVPEVDNLPIPVESEIQVPEHPPNPFAVDCKLNPQSSFYVHKGFCDGAKEILNGGAGVKKTVKAGFATVATIAKCVKCHFELDFNEIDLDVNKADRGNFIKNGIGYRLRFLQKSHLPTRRSDDVMYGCIFCIFQGKTLHASDATVFISQKALFAHLARHPRPLPAVPGFTVIEQEEVPAVHRNDYDLHFKSPVETHPVLEKTDEICYLPTATSKEAARRMYGQRLLYDRTPALELVLNAKIVGLSWPAKYMGEWAMGYHDGILASVPTEILKLDPPPSSEVKIDGLSPVQATARWKFNHKDKVKGDWLKFEKDEIITNISWPYQEYWCWSGTNAKGKTGIFPQAFIDVSTLRDFGKTGSDRASIVSNERNKSLSVLSRFSSRKTSRAGRPGSIAGSISSNEIPALPTPISSGTLGRE
ncbi:Ff.00g029420.m01.CDS01 [Fusarium sp. VM40]|nr:Ff.00g029420.m01.CDS01 [Fusarium sp. VM40]